jgi:peroxiredoxin
MKKNWPILVLGAVVLAFGIYYVTFSSNPTTPASPPANDLPFLTITKLDGSNISLYEVTGNAVLIFFRPDCDHCQNEGQQIGERKQVLRDYQVYFIAADSMKNIAKFASDYDLLENNFHFGQADNYQVYKTVGNMPSIPAIFIYHDKKLVKRFDGETKLEEIMKFL